MMKIFCMLLALVNLSLGLPKNIINRHTIILLREVDKTIIEKYPKYDYDEKNEKVDNNKNLIQWKHTAEYHEKIPFVQQKHYPDFHGKSSTGQLNDTLESLRKSISEVFSNQPHPIPEFLVKSSVGGPLGELNQASAFRGKSSTGQLQQAPEFLRIRTIGRSSGQLGLIPEFQGNGSIETKSNSTEAQDLTFDDRFLFKVASNPTSQHVTNSSKNSIHTNIFNNTFTVFVVTCLLAVQFAFE